MGPLFEEEAGFERQRLAEGLGAMARENIFIGTSSWKYEGWFGQVYRRSNYLARGRYSRRLFEEACLKEYAETFPTVCGDFSFYQFPGQDFWRKLFGLVPENFRFALKVPEQVTCAVFPAHTRYGALAGQANESFLDAELFKQLFLKPLGPYRDKTALLILEFGAFGRRSFAGLGEFLERLDPFLAALPGEFRYAVEVRNPEYLRGDYFACLRQHRVGHVYNAWSRMPELGQQIALPDSVTADFLVCRALLRRGRSFEDAVGLFSPYTEIKDPNPEAREAMRVLIQRARDRQHVAFLFVNNRLEGNAPATILSLVETGA